MENWQRNRCKDTDRSKEISESDLGKADLVEEKSWVRRQ
jgi:hypothetical protein